MFTGCVCGYYHNIIANQAPLPCYSLSKFNEFLMLFSGKQGCFIECEIFDLVSIPTIHCYCNEWYRLLNKY